MAEILVGAAMGLAVVVTGLVCYRQGIKDGAGQRGDRRMTSGRSTQEQDALMKKYEAILDYDPYGERV